MLTCNVNPGSSLPAWHSETGGEPSGKEMPEAREGDALAFLAMASRLVERATPLELQQQVGASARAQSAASRDRQSRVETQIQ